MSILYFIYSLRNQNTPGKVDTSGFGYAPADSIAVTFHVLVSYQMWGWNEQNRLVMYFGKQSLGNWTTYVGDFTGRYVFFYEVHEIILTISQGYW